MVLVIGNPLGYLNQSLTVGYISGLQREITLANEKDGTFTKLMQQ